MRTRASEGKTMNTTTPSTLALIRKFVIRMHCKLPNGSGKIIRTYDVIAIQEIRDKSQTALPELFNIVNSDNSVHDYVVSERLGRTTSKEQYAYIYNTQTVELTDTPYTYPEPAGTDPFHREPYIASFKALSGNFDVTLIVIHTDPDEATERMSDYYWCINNSVDTTTKTTNCTHDRIIIKIPAVADFTGD